MAEQSIEEQSLRISHSLNRLGRVAVRLVDKVIQNRAADIIVWPVIGAAIVSVPIATYASIEAMPTSPPAGASNATPPYYFGGGKHGISMFVDCGFSPAPHSTEMTIDRPDYASATNPVINRLAKKGKPNVVSVHEVDHYVNGTDVGWSDSFDVTVTGNNVEINGAVDGEYVPGPYRGPSNPDGSFRLRRDHYAIGKLGLMDYSLENLGGQFYMQVSCDPQKTEQLLANANSPNM